MKIYIKTYGCTLNQYDSKLAAEILIKSGHKIVENIEDAEVVVFNTCGVKDSTEKKITYKIKTTKKPKVVMGCLATGDPKLIRKTDPNAVLLGTQSISKIDDAVRDAYNGVINEYFKIENKQKLYYSFNNLIEIIGIGEGCDSNCAYCFTKIARPRLYSLRTGEIIRRIKDAAKRGVREMRLTAQDVGAYGLDHGSNLTNLLKSIAELNIPLKIRIGMTNPHHLHAQMEIIDIIRENPIFYKFYHIPQQSGSDKVLKIMGRQNTVDQFYEVVREIRKDKDANIMTDIIVGHPGEDEDDFEATLELIRKTEPDTTNVSKYSIRPGTRSAKMKQIDRRVVNQRSVSLSKLCNLISKKRNERWLNKNTKITLLEEIKGMAGRNEYYKQVIVDNGSLGESLDVRIIDAGTAYLKGKLLI